MLRAAIIICVVVAGIGLITSLSISSHANSAAQEETE